MTFLIARIIHLGFSPFSYYTIIYYEKNNKKADLNTENRSSNSIFSDYIFA